MTATREKLEETYRSLLGRPPDPEGLRVYLKKPLGWVIDQIRRSPEYRRRERSQRDGWPSVGWFGRIHEVAGYGEVARNLIPELVKLGVDIRLRANDRHRPTIRRPWVKGVMGRPRYGAIHIYHSIAPGFKLTGKRTIGFTVWETDRLAGRWVEACNRVDEVWTASHFCKDIFEKSGVKTPITVLPHGADPKRFNPGVQPLHLPMRRGFNFLSVSSGTLHRRGLDILLKAFTEEFKSSEDVSLTVKAHAPLNSMDREIYRLGGRRWDQPRIIWIGRKLPYEAMPRLYKAGDCFISPSRGEAWDLPCSEAMTMRLPVIATEWGGHLEYMTESIAYLLRIRGLVKVDVPHIRWYKDYMKWADPDVDHLKELMRYVYEHQEEAKEMGFRARRRMVVWWPWSKAGKIAYNSLKRLA